ncbi:MAG: OmpA family protein [Planctomycetota bacterium]|jgi:chemotaxis protein MotB
MQSNKFSLAILVCIFSILLTGCGPGLNDLQVQNDVQRKTIADLQSQIQADKLKIAQLNRSLGTGQGRNQIELNALQQKVAALEKNLKNKQELIASMQQQLIYGATQLPAELNTLLEDFAKQEKMVTYDPSRGIVKFESDLLFDAGSDNVAPSAVEAVKALSRILNSSQAKKFDIIIAGHTDDMRIGKPSTLAKHPTNWHLSAHRAISVLNIMADSQIEPSRVSLRGFGEFRPIEPNQANKKGNPKNRRVEIYIVPKGL